MASPPAKSTGLDPTQKAAVLLMTIGEESAAEVLKHMGPKEVQRIGIAMTTVRDLTKDMVNNVISEFMNTVNKQTALGVGVDDYVRSVLYSALGEDKAASVIDRILLGGNSQGLEALKWMAPKSIAELIQNEHPQIIAIILSYLESDMSAEVLIEFPEKVRSDLLLRIATLESVQPAAMKKLNDTLEAQLKGSSGSQSSTIGGVKAAADILNFIDSSAESAIMEKVREVDEDLGQEIQDLMFVFENLNGVDDRSMQTILREVSTDVLLLAMKAADDELKEKIYANMSKRAAEMLRDDLEAKGPVKLSEVETAQKEILSIARRLADEGQISLGGSADEELI
ncbi:MAG: flagellar motor switch protein FliG [Gammaproteobacteria bacterium]|jgi:flagellar motor switch protein FliG